MLYNDYDYQDDLLSIEDINELGLKGALSDFLSDSLNDTPVFTSNEVGTLSHAIYKAFRNHKSLYNTIEDFNIDFELIFLNNAYNLRDNIDKLSTIYEYKKGQIETMADVTDDSGTIARTKDTTVIDDIDETTTKIEDATLTNNDTLSIDAFEKPQFNDVEKNITSRDNQTSNKSQVNDYDASESRTNDKSSISDTDELETRLLNITKEYTKSILNANDLEDLQYYFDNYMRFVYTRYVSVFSSLFLTVLN